MERSDLARHYKLVKVFERGLQDLTLEIGLIGMTKRIAYLKTFRFDGAGWAHLSRFFGGNRDQYCRNTNHFDGPLDRDNCAMTNVRSAGRQNHTIGVGAF